MIVSGTTAPAAASVKQYMGMLTEMPSRYRHSAATVAIGSLCRPAATAEIDPLTLLDLKADRVAATAVMGFVAERQVLRSAAGAPEIDPGVEGQRDRHAGINIHLAHNSSPFEWKRLSLPDRLISSPHAGVRGYSG